MDGHDRVTFNHRDSYRSAFYCTSARQELKLSHIRRLCEVFLKYNVSEPLAITRSRIRNCRIIVGTGNARKCRKAIRDHLIHIELPFSNEAQMAGFSNPGSLKQTLHQALKTVLIMGPFAPKLLNSTFSQLEGLAKRSCDTTLFDMPHSEGRDDVKGSSCFQRQSNCFTHCVLIKSYSSQSPWYWRCCWRLVQTPRRMFRRELEQDGSKE